MTKKSPSSTGRTGEEGQLYRDLDRYSADPDRRLRVDPFSDEVGVVMRSVPGFYWAFTARSPWEPLTRQLLRHPIVPPVPQEK